MSTAKEKTMTEQEKVQLFIDAYNALCMKHGMQIITNPAFKSRDDGTWSVVMQTGVGKLPDDTKK